MPRSFTQSERAYIRERLIEEARLCLAKNGVRKTTVDELASGAGIPKGTFYLFYSSKELLFYEVICLFHDDIHERLIKKTLELKSALTPEMLTGLITDLCRELDGSFLMRLLADGELEYLIRRLPPETARAHALRDDSSIERLLSALPGIDGVNVSVLSAALRGIFMTMFHKREIGEDVFDSALAVLVRGVVLQLFSGKGEDLK